MRDRLFWNDSVIHTFVVMVLYVNYKYHVNKKCWKYLGLWDALLFILKKKLILKCFQRNICKIKFLFEYGKC